LARRRPIDTPETIRFVLVDGRASTAVRFRGDLLARIRAANVAVTLVAPAEEPQRLGLELAARGIDFVPLPLRRCSLNPLTDVATLAELTFHLRRLRPDVLLAATAKAVAFGCIASRLAGVRRCVALITERGYPLSEGNGIRRWMTRRGVLALYRISLPNADAVVFHNLDDLRFFREQSLIAPNQTTAVVNGSGVDLRCFDLPPPPRSPTTFLLCSRLLRAKGLGEYAEAAGILRQRHRQAQFRLLGKTDQNPDSVPASVLAQWQSAGTLCYCGSADDVRPHLAQAHVAVLPSYYGEGVPRSLLEALAAGRPVIAADTPGCRETVRDSWNGFLVPPRQPAALAAAMDRFITEPDLVARMGAHSRQLAAERFDVERINERMMQILKLGIVDVSRPSQVAIESR
jgi:glycosyltransferase involved in cell wall biosynthesis